MKTTSLQKGLENIEDLMDETLDVLDQGVHTIRALTKQVKKND